MRAGAAVFGIAFVLFGSATLIGGVEALIALIGQLGDRRGVSVFGQRDIAYVVVWVIFSSSLITAGVSLLGASYRSRRHNMVPGVTLYVAGASLMVIAFFLVASGALVYAVVAAAIASTLLIAEYSSETI